MSLAKVKTILEAHYGTEITEKLLGAYLEIEQNFFIEKWKPSELDAGHFVETIRRIIEFEQTGTYTPFDKKLSDFNDTALKSYENGSGDDSIRMLIPRILKAVYNIRNKRGIGHIKDISANEMDATLILYNVKWVLAELTRRASKKSPEETQALINEVIERQVDLVWKGNGFKRILHEQIGAKESVLILLYDETPQTVEKLREDIEYQNKTNFLKIIQELHSKRFINLKGSVCELSPKGKIAAEELIKKLKG